MGKRGTKTRKKGWSWVQEEGTGIPLLSSITHVDRSYAHEIRAFFQPILWNLVFIGKVEMRFFFYNSLRKH